MCPPHRMDKKWGNREMAADLRTLRQTRAQRLYRKWFPYLLIAPVVIYICVWLIYPLFYGVGMSLTNKSVGREGKFIGFTNFLLLLKKREYVNTVLNTFRYVLVTCSLKLIFGLIIALTLNSGLRMKGLARALLFIPWAVPAVVSIYTWKWMFSDVAGVLNAILLNTGIITKKIAWLSTPAMAFTSIVMVNVWRGAPFIGMSVLSGLQAVPKDMYEAASLDGAGTIKQFLYVTLPSIRDVVMLSGLVTMIWTFSDFNTIWLMTKGGPLNSTQVISTYSYVLSMQKMNIGQSLAATVMFMPLLIVMVNIATGKTLKKEGMA